jgi:glycosyltransferase involved in cell wall biosynthesis
VVDEGYLPLARFVAAAAAADVVACPYLVASSSAVLALAVALGRPTVASDVGGLGDLATVVVPPGDPDALAAGVERALRAGPVAPPPPVGIDAYLGAYGFRTAAVPG